MRAYVWTLETKHNNMKYDASAHVYGYGWLYICLEPVRNQLVCWQHMSLIRLNSSLQELFAGCSVIKFSVACTRERTPSRCLLVTAHCGLARHRAKLSEDPQLGLAHTT